MIDNLLCVFCRIYITNAPIEQILIVSKTDIKLNAKKTSYDMPKIFLKFLTKLCFLYEIFHSINKQYLNNTLITGMVSMLSQRLPFADIYRWISFIKPCL